VDEELHVARPPLGRTILVPIANPASAQALLVCAAHLAAPDDGTIELVTVVSDDATADEHAHAWNGLADAESAAQDLGVRASARVVSASAVGDGVLHAIAELDASLVLMGWRGGSSTTDVFGNLIDHVVGRSTVPLAVVRLGTEPFRRVLLPVSDDHLLPGGESGLDLATAFARRLQAGCEEPPTVLRTGARDAQLPESVTSLGDRIHHDPRRTHHAVAAFARADDLVVAAVAPTVSGLRAATTHLAWAAPDATLLVAVDTGPTREPGLASVQEAGAPAPARAPADRRSVRIVVTARLPDDRNVTPEHLDRVLRGAGATDHLMAWWPAGDPRPHVRATVTLEAAGINAAISAVMVAVHDAPELRGAEISYDVDRGPASQRTDPTLRVDESIDVSVTADPTGDVEGAR
jgi:nucleotide-binding universal stress UspA family protein